MGETSSNYVQNMQAYNETSPVAARRLISDLSLNENEKVERVDVHAKSYKPTRLDT